MKPDTKLPQVGTTIFTVMSQLAAEHDAVNLGQGFPDFDVPGRLVDALDRAMRDGHNQYAPMTGIPALREPTAGNAQRVYGAHGDPDNDGTVTSGATEATMDADVVRETFGIASAIIPDPFTGKALCVPAPRSGAAKRSG